MLVQQSCLKRASSRHRVVPCLFGIPPWNQPRDLPQRELGNQRSLPNIFFSTPLARNTGPAWSSVGKWGWPRVFLDTHRDWRIYYSGRKAHPLRLAASALHTRVTGALLQACFCYPGASKSLGMGSKIKTTRIWTAGWPMFPFTRVPFWLPMFDPPEPAKKQACHPPTLRAFVRIQ